MFKALHLHTQEEFISIAPQWSEHMPQLRALGQGGLLICQGCREPVLLRAGGVRRPHFAHKSLQDCFYGHASPQRLQARAVLYARLVQEFGAAVTVEKQLEGTSLLSPVDCWVERPSGFLAYWIIEGSIKSQQERSDLRQALAGEKGGPKASSKLRIKANWVFLKMCSPEKGELERIDLNTTEREFIVPSAFDRVGGQPGGVGRGSLHYLNSEAETLTTLRSLRPVHRPRIYAARRLVSPLADVLIAPKTGEFVHPGERELWQEERRLREERRLQKAREAQRQEEEHQKWLAAEQQRATERLLQKENFKSPTNVGPVNSHRVPGTGWSGSHLFKEGICRLCGTKTRDWFVFDNVTQTCECNACLRKNSKTEA